MKQKAPREFKLENCLKLLWVRLVLRVFLRITTVILQRAILRGNRRSTLYIAAAHVNYIFVHLHYSACIGMTLTGAWPFKKGSHSLVHYAYERHELKKLINMCLCEINDAAIFLSRAIFSARSGDSFSLCRGNREDSRRRTASSSVKGALDNRECALRIFISD